MTLWGWLFVMAFWVAALWIAFDARRHRSVCDFIWRVSYGSQRAPEWYVRVTRPAIVFVSSLLAIAFTVELVS